MNGRSTGEMSWGEAWELQRAYRYGDRRPPSPRAEEGGYSYEEVMEEIRLIVGDAARFLGEDPTRGTVALGTAEFLAHRRDDGRPRAQREVPLGEVGSGLAQWLIRRADRDDVAAGAQAAWFAVNDCPEQAALAQELRERVRSYVDGSLSREEEPPSGEDALASAAASALTGILAEASTGDDPDASATWEAFKRFVALPFSPDAPERLEDGGGDMLLCESGVFEWPSPDDAPEASTEMFLVDLVRQFSVVGADGEYDRMLQVHCTLGFEPKPELRALESDTIWSDTKCCQQWFDEVEQSAAFAAVRNGTLLTRHVVGERV